MDPITLAITTALGGLGTKVINDAYQALKVALQHKYGLDSDLVEAMNKVEEKPESKARKSVLQEEMTTAEADKDSDILELAQVLLDKLDGDQAQSQDSTIINQQAGDNAMQFGQVGGDVSIKR